MAKPKTTTDQEMDKEEVMIAEKPVKLVEKRSYITNGPDLEITKKVEFYQKNPKVECEFRLLLQTNTASGNYHLKDKPGHIIEMGKQSWVNRCTLFIDDQSYQLILSRTHDIFIAHEKLMKDGVLTDGVVLPVVEFTHGSIHLRGNTGFNLRMIEFLLYQEKYLEGNPIAWIDNMIAARDNDDKFTLAYQMTGVLMAFQDEPDGIAYLKTRAAELVPYERNVEVLEDKEFMGILKQAVSINPVRFREAFYQPYKTIEPVVEEALALNQLVWNQHESNWQGCDLGGKRNVGEYMMDSCGGKTETVRKIRLYQWLKDHEDDRVNLKTRINRAKENR